MGPHSSSSTARHTVPRRSERHGVAVRRAGAAKRGFNPPQHRRVFSVKGGRPQPHLSVRGMGERDWGRVLGKRDQRQLIQASRSGYNYLLTNELMVNGSVICLIQRDYLTKPNKAISRRAYQIILICCQVLLRSYLVALFHFSCFLQCRNRILHRTLCDDADTKRPRNFARLRSLSAPL